VNRIFPLYLLAFVITLVGVQLLLRTAIGVRSAVILTPSQTIVYLIGAQGPLIPRFVPSFFEFWFVGVIIMFYALYLPLTYYSSNNLRRLIPLSIVIFFVLFAVKLNLNTIDSRFFLYYFVFIGGVTSVILARKFNILTNIRMHSRLILPMAALLFAVLLVLQRALSSNNGGDITSFYDVGSFCFFTVLILLFVFLAFFSARFLASFDMLLPVFKSASYASYSVYLFHAPLLVALHAVLIRLPIISSFGADVLMIVVGIPVSFIIPYFIQRVADILTTKLAYKLRRV
jgi:peptidoglycan/LPS O-acetylase OafA/YrhL